jgi:hypothetical protein
MWSEHRVGDENGLTLQLVRLTIRVSLSFASTMEERTGRLLQLVNIVVAWLCRQQNAREHVRDLINVGRVAGKGECTSDSRVHERGHMSKAVVLGE